MLIQGLHPGPHRPHKGSIVEGIDIDSLGDKQLMEVINKIFALYFFNGLLGQAPHQKPNFYERANLALDLG